MTPSATVWTIFFIHIGVVLVATSYYAFSAALAPRITQRARIRFGQRPWLPLLIGVGVSLPWVIVAILALQQPVAGVKFVGAVALSIWILLGLIGGAGIAQHIGRAPQSGDGSAASTWTDCIRGGLFITLTWVLPLVGWFAMLPLTLATGIGCLILGLFPMRNEPQRPHAPERAMVAAPVVAT